MTVDPRTPAAPTRAGRLRRARWWPHDTETRWTLVWDGFTALTLAVPTVAAVVQPPTAGHAVATLALAVGLALWHWLTALRRPDWDDRAPMLLWLTGVLVFTWALLGRHEAYLFLLYGIYPQLFARLGRWTIPGVAALTAVVAWRVGALTADDPAARWGLLGSIVLALLVGFFVTALARQTAAREQALAALEATRAELAATERHAGALAERERLTTDLHDTIAQGFTGIVMQLEAAEQALDTAPDTAADHLERAKHAARDSLGELRRAVHAMRPQALEHGDLAQAIERITHRWSQQTGIPATTATTGSPRPLTPDTEVALLRVAQEALTNVARHAHAHSVELQLTYALERVALTVTDDGVGFEPETAADGGGIGLDGLSARLDTLGGQLTIDSAPGQGTTLVAEVPTP